MRWVIRWDSVESKYGFNEIISITLKFEVNYEV